MRHRRGIYNTEESVRGFALSCLNFGLERGFPVYLGTKNTALEQYDGLFKNTFQEVYDTRFRTRFEERGIHYEHRMVDELAAFAIRSSGGFVWACKNYDGDIQSDMVAAGFGSLGLGENLHRHGRGRVHDKGSGNSDGRRLVADDAAIPGKDQGISG